MVMFSHQSADWPHKWDKKTHSHKKHSNEVSSWAENVYNRTLKDTSTSLEVGAHEC